MKKLLFLLVFIPLVSFGQDYGNSIDAMKLCSVLQTNNFGTDAEAEKGLDRILSVIGASKRFVLQPCDNINNAVAASYKGIRYIFYDRDFMSSVNSGNNWKNLFILAHEVGHHINGHSLDLVLYAAEVVEPESLANQRKQELEADEFAGFILGKLGATLEQTSATINLIASDSDDTYLTHPSKSKRLSAISIGHNKALGNKTVTYETSTKLQTAAEYFYRAYDVKAKQNDHSGAIADYTKVIELIPNSTNAYNFRGFSKSKLEDYYGAIADHTKAIELDPNYAGAYNFRGFSKSKLKDYYGAIADYTKAIELNPNYTKAYYERGNSKGQLEDYYGAISDYTKAIELNPAVSPYYYIRGIAKEILKDYYGAIADFTKVIELDNFPEAYLSRGNSKWLLEDYYGAIADFTKAIELYPNYAIAYNKRGNSKYLINDIKGACEDWKKAGNLGLSVPNRYRDKFCN